MIAAGNIIKLINSHDNNTELDEYTPHSPGIKLTLGLRASVTQMDGVVDMKEEGGEDDAGASVMWMLMGAGEVVDENV